jgi:hypothetical protein
MRVPTGIQMMEAVRMPYEVPYYAQLASPDWIGRVFDEGCDPIVDPNWEMFGTKDADAYLYWAPRACGMACVKMVVEALGGPNRSMMNWVKQGLERDGYQRRLELDGSYTELGWSHTVLAALISTSGFPARSAQADLTGIVNALRQGMPVIVSISYELGTTRCVTRNNGHLGVVTGCELAGDQPQTIYLHNPSGRTEALRMNARIPADRFAEGYSGRAILIG